MNNQTNDWIRLSDLQKFPIRIDHYDRIHGDEKYVFGVEDVIEYAENLPRVDLSCLWHDAVSDPPLESGYYLVFCKGHSVPEVLYFRGKKWACESSPYRKPIFWTEYPPLPKEVNP